MPKEDSEHSYSLLSSSNVGHTSNLPTVDIEEVPEIKAFVDEDIDIDNWVDLASMYFNTNKSLPDEYRRLKLRTRVHGVANAAFKRLIKEHSNVDSGEELEVDWNLVLVGMKQASEEWRVRQRREAIIITIVVLSIMIGSVIIVIFLVTNAGHTSSLPTVDIEEVPEIKVFVNADIDTWIDLASMYVYTNKSLPDEYKEVKLRTRVHGVANAAFKRLIKEHSKADSGEELEVDWNLVWEGMKRASEEWRVRHKRSDFIIAIINNNTTIAIPSTSISTIVILVIIFLITKFGVKK